MNKVMNVVTKVEEFILSYSVIGMAALLIISVIMRTIFNSSLTFSEEVGQALLVLISFFGLEYCARKGRNISMSIVFDKVNNKKKKVFIIIISIVSAVAMIYITYLAFGYVMSVKGLGRVTPALQMPMYIIYTTVPVGFLLVSIEYIRTFILNIMNKDELYITSEIHISIEEEILTDLNSFIDAAVDENKEAL
ncbi:TRAP transporter small permease [Sedimentibacter sp. MB31-C6]|uniref:TRAP transporter small permease n=1 Tax=Sedimentibacter sp. MB31-C6 TaxID=3109366 RepID=UPI002DDD9182|nr:TRAP transporter small permease subunit [Sedimentibacter sp. MB36-C1]WSI03448.1 TRAP transporter small permease subunit [Sedimentibacter sp. MB36-C1]